MTMNQYMRGITSIAGLIGLIAIEGASPPNSQPALPWPRPVNVLIISMFGPEAQPFIDNLVLDQEIVVPGLSPDCPAVHCNRDQVCQVTTGMGHTNVAATISALVFSHSLDRSLSVE
jgi:purine nucleoside permease